MKRYVEVFGESEYTEIPKALIVDLDISVRAAKDHVAHEEIRSIVNTALDQLFENGLTKDEVFFGGKETFAPWWRRNKVGIETRNRITIRSTDKERAYCALEKLERYKDNKRILFQIHERQPVFEPDQVLVDAAYRSAVSHGKAKAELLALSANMQLGDVIEVQEYKRGTRGSGSYGDYDWGDYDGIVVAAAAGAGGEAEEPAARVEGNKRTVFIKLRLKYELI